jgi:hypothetical protein
MNVQEARAVLPLTSAPQACGPTVHQICKENMYVNGFCFLFGSNLLQQPQRFPGALRGEFPLAEKRGWGQDLAVSRCRRQGVGGYDWVPAERGYGKCTLRKVLRHPLTL